MRKTFEDTVVNSGNYIYMDSTNEYICKKVISQINRKEYAEQQQKLADFNECWFYWQASWKAAEVPLKNLTALQALMHINQVCQFSSNEKKGEKASNSELRRWLDQNSVEVNFDAIKSKDEWPSVVKSIVLFPKSAKKRTTLFYDETVTLIQVKEQNHE